MNCDKGHNGQCCCNCQYQTPITKHPWNKGEANGSILDHFGYACTVFNSMDSKEPFVFFNSQHGSCEMYTPKQIYKP
jgi:hypothetical protein